MPSGRPKHPVPSALTRGWCHHCRDLTVRGDTLRCTICGGGLARGYELVEADVRALRQYTLEFEYETAGGLR